MINLKSLREQVYEFLRKELHSGNLIPGDNINLNLLSRQLGTSKTPLRDALLQLEVEGFVVISPRSGVYVNKLTLDAIRHCYEIAGALETGVISSNFDKIGGNHIAKMRWLNEGLRSAVEREDFDTVYELNLAFHNVFMDLSDNAALRHTVDIIKQRLYDFPRRGYIISWELRNCEEHDLLLDAFERRDILSVKTVWMDRHWGYPVQEEYIRPFYFPGGIESGADPTPLDRPSTIKKKLRQKAKITPAALAAVNR